VSVDSLRAEIREVPDFPKPGILFYDITTLIKQAKPFAESIDLMVEPFKDAKVDIYTGVDDHALRRLALSVSLAVPKDAQQQAGGLKSGDLRFDLTIADLNKDQTIEAPADALPFSALQSQLAALQGTASSGGQQTQTTPPQTSTSTGTSSVPSSGAPPKYLECVSKAGTDIAQVQKCASLVNGG